MRMIRRTLRLLVCLLLFARMGFGEETALSGTVRVSLTSLSERGTFSPELVSRLLSDPDLSARLIGELSEAVLEQGWGGVDMDFEYIPAE